MMKKLALSVLLSFVFLFASAQSTGNKAINDTTAVYTEQWEYTAFYCPNTHPYARQGEVEFAALKDAETFNRYGREGWELVAVTPIIAEPMGNNRTYTQKLLFTFKRRLRPKR